MKYYLQIIFVLCIYVVITILYVEAEELLKEGINPSARDDSILIEPEPIVGYESDYLVLYTNTSTLPLKSVGIGVFAKYDIPENEIICEYRGVAIDPEHRLKVPSDKYFYIRTANGQPYALLGNSLCSLINDAAHIVQEDAEGDITIPYTEQQLDQFEQSSDADVLPTYANYRYNAQYIQANTGKIFIVSLVNITAGEEIFYSYGK